MESTHEYMKKFIEAEYTTGEQGGPGGIRIAPRLEDLPSELLRKVKEIPYPERPNWAYSTKMSNEKWDIKKNVKLKDAILQCLFSAKFGNECRLGTMAQYKVYKDQVPPDYATDTPEGSAMVELAKELNQYFEQEFKRMRSLGVLQRQPEEPPQVT